MFRSIQRHPFLPGACLVVLAMAACEGRNRSEAARESAAATDTAMAPAAPTDTAATGAKLSDPNIVALLDEANMADSAAGAVAATKATSKEVKDFARLMMTEHHALRQAGQQLAKQLKVTPEPPASDPVKPLADGEMKALESTAKGKEFDRVYIEQEVAAHKAVLDLANKAHDQAQNEQLKALIEKAKPVIQKHLDQAEALQSKLGEATT
jgi:putative membrane protein